MKAVRLAVGVAAWIAVLAGPAGASPGSPAGVTPQPPPATSQSSQTQTPPPPDNLERIRAGVQHQPKLKIENGQLRIYVEVIAKWPTFEEIAKGYDLKNGPTGRGNPMSHQEFLNMVTPREMSGSGGVSAPQILTMALVNYVGQAVVKRGLKEISEARNEKEIREIRARIDAELAALRGGI